MSLAELKSRSATLATKLITVPVNVAAAGSATIRVIQPGQLFLVYGFYLQNAAAVQASVIWKSGSTAISGDIVLVASTATAIDSLAAFAEIPILKGRASGDDLVLTITSGGAVSIQGWCVVTEGSF